MVSTAEKKAKKAQIKARFKNPYQQGDILHHSWGYDQTNCDFYQVVEVKKASVVLRMLNTSPVPGSEGFMSDSLMPNKDDFKRAGHHALTKYGDTLTPEHPTIMKRVSAYIQDDDSMKYFIPVPYGWCDLWKGKPEQHSWYA